MKNIELLAPAGDFDAFQFAIDAGADAVYIGGEKYSARAFSNNFDLEEIKVAVEYAHIRNVQVYVAVNTLILTHEFDECITYLDELYKLNVDAIIVQDYGLLNVALKRFYVVEDVSRAAEGFSQTWYPHLYRVKLKQIYDSQEFKEILNKDAGAGDGKTLRDVLSTYEQEMQINNAVVQQAEADSPKSGYDIAHFYTLQVDDNGKPELVTTDTTQLDATTQNTLADRVTQTPSKEGYDGYILGDGIAPNGEQFGFGISFPATSDKGDYFLRTDFLPNRLFRRDNSRWVKMEDNIRMTLTNTDTRSTQKGTFVNNTKTSTIAGESVTERQSLSKALRPKADN